MYYISMYMLFNLNIYYVSMFMLLNLNIYYVILYRGEQTRPPTSLEVETLIIYNNKKLETRKGMFKKTIKLVKKTFKKVDSSPLFYVFLNLPKLCLGKQTNTNWRPVL